MTEEEEDPTVDCLGCARETFCAFYFPSCVNGVDVNLKKLFFLIFISSIKKYVNIIVMLSR